MECYSATVSQCGSGWAWIVVLVPSSANGYTPKKVFHHKKLLENEHYDTNVVILVSIIDIDFAIIDKIDWFGRVKNNHIGIILPVKKVQGG